MENKYFILSLIIVCSSILAVSLISTSSLIRYFVKKNLVDIPDERKKHKVPTPSSGGIVFGFAALLLFPFVFDNSNFMVPYLCGFGLLLVGFYDDRKDLSARIKFAFQIVAALLAINIIGTIPLFGEANYLANQIFTFLFIIGFTNAFNLIDGVDGLAGTYGAFVLITFGVLLFWCNQNELAIYAFGLAASIFGFLRYNLVGAKIFMGDAGTLFLGFTISVLTILITQSEVILQQLVINKATLFLCLLATLAVPIFDTLRVMIGRIIRKKSPLKADRSHLHHLLQKIGLNAIKTAFFTLITTFLLLTEVLFLNYLEVKALFILLGLISTVLLLFNLLLYIRIKQHTKNKVNYKNSLYSITQKNYLLNRTNSSTLKN